MQAQGRCPREGRRRLETLGAGKGRFFGAREELRGGGWAHLRCIEPLAHINELRLHRRHRLRAGISEVRHHRRSRRRHHMRKHDRRVDRFDSEHRRTLGRRLLDGADGALEDSEAGDGDGFFGALCSEGRFEGLELSVLGGGDGIELALTLEALRAESHGRVDHERAGERRVLEVQGGRVGPRRCVLLGMGARELRGSMFMVLTSLSSFSRR